MKKAKQTSRELKLLNAVLWTVIALMWIVIAAFRMNDRYVGQGLKIVTVLTLLVSAAACAANWYRFSKCDGCNDQ